MHFKSDFKIRSICWHERNASFKNKQTKKLFIRKGFFFLLHLSLNSWTKIHYFMLDNPFCMETRLESLISLLSAHSPAAIWVLHLLISSMKGTTEVTVDLCCWKWLLADLRQYATRPACSLFKLIYIYFSLLRPSHPGLVCSWVQGELIKMTCSFYISLLPAWYKARAGIILIYLL